MSAAALSRVVVGPCAVRRTWARTEISMRENREVPRSPVVSTDAPSWMVRGVVDRHWRVVRGTLWR
jgi:hypothetical protein